MKNLLNFKLPPELESAFPAIKDMVYIRTFTPTVPFYPDTLFHLLHTKEDNYLAIVATDHPDPINQSSELKNLSSHYKIEFVNLLLPRTDGETVELNQLSSLAKNFTVRSLTDHWKYYIATVKLTL